MKLSLLTIGTEITDGQILNTNAHTLAQKFTALGFKVIRHLSVPDDKELMLQSFSLADQDSDIVCLVGGLGPTSDDFTRVCLAEFLKHPLEWDQTSWDHIVKRLTARGIKVADTNKQQCYYPRGSNILHNPQGTANAFEVLTPHKHFIVLPGPPREIQAILDHNHLLQKLKKLYESKLQPETLLKWKVMGVSESVLQEWVSDVLGSDFVVGYRPHPPYVEIKIWVPFNQSIEHPKIQKLDDVLKPYLLYRNDEDPCLRVLTQLHSHSFKVYEVNLNGFFYERLKASSSTLTSQLQWFINAKNIPLLNPEESLLFIECNGDEAKLVIQHNGQTQTKILKSPFHGSLLLDRSQKYFVEMTLIELMGYPFT